MKNTKTMVEKLASLGIDYRFYNLICLTYELQKILIEERFGSEGIPQNDERDARLDDIQRLADWWALKLRGEAVTRLRKWGVSA
jgi:hypothetical protein